jgi:hypothetical protein
MKRTILAVTLVAAAVGFLFTACEPFGNAGDIEYMAEEVYVYEEEIPTDITENRVAPRAKGGRNRVDDFEYRIVRVAQIPPVVVEGVTTQANDVVISGDIAVIAYNTRGDVFAGAIQVVDISNPRYPVITTEIALDGMDVNAVDVTDTYIYIAGAADPDTIVGYVPFDRAFIARIPRADLATITDTTIALDRVILTSFAANGITLKGDTVFVTTGAVDGELEILSAALVADTGITGYNDLRDVEEYHGGVIALQGTYNGESLPAADNGNILIFKSDGSLRTALPITDFGSVGAKSTIEVFDKHYAFVGLSEAGFEAYYLKQNVDDAEPAERIFQVANPTVEWTTETDTNSVSYSDDLVFTANGEAGFRVFRITGDLRQDVAPSELGEKVGFVPFDETLQPSGDYWSANHVEYRDQLLVVASGLGGVNFYGLSAR